MEPSSHIEIQVHTSPHAHCFLWIWNEPTLTESIVNEYISLVDTRVHATLPTKNTDPELHELAKLYQLHRHSKTCCKYKSETFF